MSERQRLDDQRTGLADPACDWHAGRMLGLIVLLLVVWLVVSVLGLVLEGLFWLFVIGVILFLATAAYGWVKRRT